MPSQIPRPEQQTIHLMCKQAIRLIRLNNMSKIRSEQSSPLNPGLLGRVSVLLKCSQGCEATYINQLLIGMLLAAQNEERRKVVGLDQGEVTSVV